MATTFTITAVLDAGDDVLKVEALDPDGNKLEAFGWVSATTNHYDASAYTTDAAGNLHRDPAALPRAMTAAEVGEYAHSLLLAQHPELAAPAAASTAIAFVPPA